MMIALLILVIVKYVHTSYELKHYGVKVYAKVIGRHEERTRTINYYDDLEYVYNNIIRNAHIDDYEKAFNIGDTVILKCSSRDSSIYDLVGRRVNGKDYQRAGE